MKLLSIFRRSEPEERRTGKFTLRKHEALPNHYRVIRIRDGKPFGVVEGLRRAEDLAVRMENYVEPVLTEHDKKQARIREMIRARKENWIYAGQVSEDDQAA